MRSTDSQLPLLFVMGPTGAGKTELAVQLAARYPVSIISVDSAMVYRGLDIGTAKPSRAVLARFPHRLIDICDPVESYSAARFRADASAEIEHIHAQGRVPLLVGGTGLYFRALERGLAKLPSADQGLRRRLRTEIRAQGLPALYQRLIGLDPAAAARIHPNDPQRIMRALEVCEIAGAPMTELLARNAAGLEGYRIVKVVLAPTDRPTFHTSLAVRFQGMVDTGLIGEVEDLNRSLRLDKTRPAMRLVGYRQVYQYLRGEVSHDEMIARAVVATRQLAKRQLTWLRTEQHSRWFDCQDPDVQAQVVKFVDTPPVFAR